MECAGGAPGDTSFPFDGSGTQQEGSSETLTGSAMNGVIHDPSEIRGQNTGTQAAEPDEYLLAVEGRQTSTISNFRNR
jgi:hypothetical protein